MTRLPPVRVVRAATAVRTALQGATRRMVPPEIAVLEVASGFMATQMTYAFARLAVADAFDDAPTSAADVATALGTHPDATHRLLRACAGIGLVRQQGVGHRRQGGVLRLPRRQCQLAARDACAPGCRNHVLGDAHL